MFFNRTQVAGWEAALADGDLMFLFISVMLDPARLAGSDKTLSSASTVLELLRRQSL